MKNCSWSVSAFQLGLCAAHCALGGKYDLPTAYGGLLFQNFPSGPLSMVELAGREEAVPLDSGLGPETCLLRAVFSPQNERCFCTENSVLEGAATPLKKEQLQTTQATCEKLYEPQVLEDRLEWHEILFAKVV